MTVLMYLSPIRNNYEQFAIPDEHMCKMIKYFPRKFIAIFLPIHPPAGQAGRFVERKQQIDFCPF